MADTPTTFARVATAFGLFLALSSSRVAHAATPSMTDESYPVPAPDPSAVSLANARVVLGVERSLGLSRTFSPHFHETSGVTPGTWSGDPAVWSLGVPRLAIDAVVGRWTIGAAFALMTPDHDMPLAGSLTQSHLDATVALVAPRAGLLLCDRRRVCFWPKVGFTYAVVTGDSTALSVDSVPHVPGTRHVTYKALAANVEPQLVVGLVPHLALTATASFDAASLDGANDYVLGASGTAGVAGWW